MHVAIPSKSRAAKCKSHKLITSAFVYVPEIEVEAYRKMLINNVVGIPMNVHGITQSRNWILDHVDDPRIVFIDDDVKTAGFVQLHSHDGEHIKMDEGEFLFEWDKLFDLAEQLHYRIWGISTDGAPRSVYPYKPFLFRSYITASCMGILNNTGIRFDESFKVKEDYEICLRCIKEDGGILAARYFYWVNDHWTLDGGCKDYHTQEMEKDSIRRLIKMYPGLIRRVTRGGSEFSIELNF